MSKNMINGNSYNGDSLDERNSQAIAMYAQGAGIEHIAQKFSLSKQGVCYIFHRIYNGKMPTTIDVLSEEQIEKVKILLSQGLSEREICDQLSIRRYLLQRSIPASIRLPKKPLVRKQRKVPKVPYDVLIPEALEMEKIGLTHRHIANHFGISQATVDAVLSKYRRGLITLER